MIPDCCLQYQWYLSCRPESKQARGLHHNDGTKSGLAHGEFAIFDSVGFVGVGAHAFVFIFFVGLEIAFEEDDLGVAFEGEDVDGRRVVVGSTMTLRRQLDELNVATWKASAAVVGQWGREPPAEDTALELCARYAFAILFDLSRAAAIERRLPMKMDY